MRDGIGRRGGILIGRYSPVKLTNGKQILVRCVVGERRFPARRVDQVLNPARSAITYLQESPGGVRQAREQSPRVGSSDAIAIAVLDRLESAITIEPDARAV